ncbi:hypothetical protein [Breznakia pachnodae]|uniref:Lipoprotein n=1 Tax=Breznakia pachnodae TaxID=265178 RepID=A0ABU0E5B1_9FIRM|nr:hypothetical protein [Breznakia pachnodae]MDQ0362006.1 hypothetical protein [Breznakia pachnodae]
MRRILLFLIIPLFCLAVGCANAENNKEKEEFMSPKIEDQSKDDYYVFITNGLDDSLGLEVMVFEYIDNNGEVENQFAGVIGNEKIEYGSFPSFGFNKELDGELGKLKVKLKLYDDTYPDEDVESGKVKPFGTVELTTEIKYGEWEQYVVKQDKNGNFTIDPLK